MSVSSKSYNAVVEVKDGITSTNPVPQTVTTKKEGLARLKALRNESNEVKKSMSDMPTRSEPKRYKSKTYPDSGEVLVLNEDSQESMECDATKHTLVKDLLIPAIQELDLSLDDVKVMRYVAVDLDAKLFDINPCSTTITVSRKKRPRADSESDESESGDETD